MSTPSPRLNIGRTQADIDRVKVAADSRQPRALDGATLRRASDAAERALRRGGRDRSAIEACFAALVAGLEEHLLASVYVREHDRLWLIAQRGYSEVLDGFSLERGVMARAVRTGTTQFVPDARADPDFLEATTGILAEVTVPFASEAGTSTEGAFNIETVGATLPDEARTIFEPLAKALGERVGEMRESLEVGLGTLVRLCVHASSLRGSSPIAEFAARTIGRLLQLECAQLDLRTDTGSYEHATFWRRDSSGLEPLAPAAMEELALLDDESGVSPAYHLFDLRLTAVGDDHLDTPWGVWFPLMVGGSPVGAILGRAARRPGPEHERVEAATLFAQHPAALLDVSLALRRERRAAVTDALTGQLNRRGFDDVLRDELDRARNTGARVALVLADCDDLKAINDRGGHELGDRVLEAFGSCLRSAVRAEDAVARIGGDEFAIVVSDADRRDAVELVKRLRDELQRLSIPDVAAVAAAYGVAAYPADGETAADLLRAADRALYVAKQAGKQRVVARPADAA